MEDVFISALVLGPRCPNATLRVGISRASRLLMRAVRRSDLFRSKKMNVLRDSRSSRFALRLQFFCAQYSTSPSMLLARQVNVQQCVSFLFVSPTSSLSSLERWPSPYCLNVPADVCACLRGRKRGHSVLYNWVLPLCGPESYVFVTYASVTMAWAWSQTWYSVHSVMEFYAAAQKTPIFMNDGVNQLGHCKN